MTSVIPSKAPITTGSQNNYKILNPTNHHSTFRSPVPTMDNSCDTNYVPSFPTGSIIFKTSTDDLITSPSQNPCSVHLFLSSSIPLTDTSAASSKKPFRLLSVVIFWGNYHYCISVLSYVPVSSSVAYRKLRRNKEHIKTIGDDLHHLSFQANSSYLL